MSRVESAAAGIVTECMLRGGRAMTLGCRMMDGQIWRVECERVDSEEEANITREQLRDALRVATKDYHDLLRTLEIRGEICKRLFDTLPKASEYEYSERYGTHVYTLTIKRQPTCKEDGHGG